MKATAILPVKRFARAKTRLVEEVGPPGRALLLRAMLADVLAALDKASAIERIIVVTGEGRAEKIAMEHAKRTTTPIEVMRDPDDRGHSEAAVLGIMRAKALGAGLAALLPGDCPLISADELDAVLGSFGERSVGVIPDRHGTGTNGLLLAPCDAIGPAFGEGSRAKHLDRAERAGWNAAALDVASLALDLDTPGDLAELRTALAADPGLAPNTAGALAEL